MLDCFRPKEGRQARLLKHSADALENSAVEVLSNAVVLRSIINRELLRGSSQLEMVHKFTGCVFTTSIGVKEFDGCAISRPEIGLISLVGRKDLNLFLHKVYLLP